MTNVEFWRFGAAPVPTTQIADYAKRFEAQGWDGLIVGQDIGGTADPYVLLALAAAATTTLKLGTSVSVPIREPMDLANTIAVLYAVSAGRSLISLGRGDGAFARVARKPLNTAEFTLYLQRIQRYLKSEVVDLDGFDSSLAALFEGDASLAGPKPPIDVSATGPKTIELAARNADSITFAVGANVQRLTDAIALARSTREMAGLDPMGLQVGCHIPAAVAVDRTDMPAARDIVRGAVLRHARFSAFGGSALGGVSADDRVAVLATVAGTRDHERGIPKPPDYSVASLVDDEFVDRFAIVGDPAECADRLQAVMATGVQRISLITRVPTTDPEEGNSARLAEHVLSRLR